MSAQLIVDGTPYYSSDTGALFDAYLAIRAVIDHRSEEQLILAGRTTDGYESRTTIFVTRYTSVHFGVIQDPSDPVSTKFLNQAVPNAHEIIENYGTDRAPREDEGDGD